MVKPAVITNVFYLSCVLVFFYDSAQTDCDPGWMGPGCKYKCRCLNDKCKDNGQCWSSYPCSIGWFGPACQFADLAYNKSDTWEVTDANDSTCIRTGNAQTVALTFSTYYHFTWLRAVASKANVLHNLSASFEKNNNYIPIANPKVYDVSETTVDIYCDLGDSFNQISLFGDAVRYLCSVYVSSGRNLALKENAVQSTTYNERSYRTDEYLISFKASLAVDGSREQNYYTKPYCASTNDIKDSSWEVHLSRPQLINRYRVYNRDQYGARLLGFRLDSYDGSNNNVFNYTDTLSAPLSVYEVSHPPLTVQRLKLRSGANSKMLTLCEVEIYGDTICETGKYGFECNNKCNCRKAEACTVSSGFCPSGCAIGYRWNGCSVECGENTFGLDCNRTCSTECIQPNISHKTSCDHVNGTCLYGCHRTGYTGSTCSEKCGNGFFGVGCQEVCSSECKPPSEVGAYLCDHVNGTCLNGCKRGFFGSLCNEPCHKGTYGEDCKHRCNINCAPPLDSEKSPCYHINGICRSGCTSGFTGSSCAEASLFDRHTKIIMGLCVAAALIFIIIFCLFHQRKAIRTSAPEDVQQTPATKKEGILKRETDDRRFSNTSSNPLSFNFSTKSRTSKSKAYADNRQLSVSV